MLTSTDKLICFGKKVNQRGFAIRLLPTLLFIFLINENSVSANPPQVIQTAITNEPYVEINLPDVSLVDQDGKQVNFASQSVGDHIVAINFIYTTCNTLCPLTSAIFKQLQDKLANRLGRDIWLISISLDPLTDIPTRLKEYASNYRTNSGWIWLTGSASNVEQVLTGLGATSTNFREHAPLTLVGDGKSGKWIRFNTLTGPEQISTELERLLAARKKATRQP